MSFMFSGCLGALDINGMGTMLLITSTIPSHQALQMHVQLLSAPGNYYNIDDQLLQLPASQCNFL